MALFAFACLFSFGMGSVIGGLIASQPHMGWRWVQWIHVMQAFHYSPVANFLNADLQGLNSARRSRTGGHERNTQFSHSRPFGP